jgi:hypothetical protein
MKKCTAILAILVLALHAYGQVPNGSTAPDFNVTDINGQSHHLYDLLDQNKVVLIEISATWCPPCWAYHNSHAVQNFYNIHGPDGDDQARVLFIEGDPATNVSCLYGQSGCNNYTAGDWVTGTNYPIIDNSTVADSFHITYYPSIFVVCPNKKTYTIGQLDAAGLWAKASKCPIEKGNYNAGIFDYDAGSPLREICDSLNLGPHFTLINLGANALNAATIQLEWNGSIVQTIHWTGDLPLFGEAKIGFTPYPVTGNGGNLKTTIASINNGTVDDDFSNNVHNNDFYGSATFSSQKILMKIKTDNYGNETYWELRDKSGNVLDHGGNENVGPNGGGSLIDVAPGPGTYGNGVLINYTLTVPGPGCYSMHFVDAYGDGICCGFGNGYYRLYNISNPALPILTGGEFGAYDDRAFGVQDQQTETQQPIVISNPEIFPNPATDQIQIRFDLLEPSRVSTNIVNAVGQTVYQSDPSDLTTGEQQWTVPVRDLPSGLYLIQFHADNFLISRKFVIQK